MGVSDNEDPNAGIVQRRPVAAQVSQRILVRWVDDEAILAGVRVIDEFKNYVVPDAFQITVAPVLEWIQRGGSASLFQRALVAFTGM